MLAKKALLTFGTKGSSLIFGFAVTFFVARSLGPERYGIMGFALAFTGFFTALGELGFASAHLKRISENKNIGRCIGTFFSIRGILIALLLTVSLLVIYFIKKFGNGFETKTHEIVIYIFLASLVFKNIVTTITLTFDGKLETAKSQLVEFVMMFTNAVLSIFIAIIMPSIILLAGAILVSAVVALTVALYLFRGYPVERPTADSVKSYVSFAAPLAAVAVIRPFYYYLDTLLIQAFNSSKDVGYYYGAQKLPNFILLISDAVLTILLAAVSQFYTKGDMGAMRELCKKAERYLSLIVSPLVMFLIVFAKPVIEILLGSQYLSSVPIMRFLLLQALFLTIGRPASVLIVGIGRNKLYALEAILEFPLMIIFYFILIPKSLFGVKMFGYGTQGAALTLMLMSFIGFTASKIIAFKLAGVKLNKRIFFHSLVALLSCAGVSAAANVLSFNSRMFLPLFFVITCVIYFGALWFTRQINISDIDFFNRMCNVKDMKNYVKAELKMRGTN